ncbi:hypothetical protein KIN20_004485 [Parelaphostrongylus tenuis]|uniref:Uncharacterized protein n=1 Tax=Parelaphostrongylus tenuis TaxID=148309 RepID=A0AAD5QGW1_PARTN|nr:hypothetical protein KIN20_004485 [Parelaphostrongylus tenuis]
MVKIFHLFIYIAVVCLQHAVIVCNGFVLYLFTKEKGLRQNTSRVLVLFLAATDFLHAVTTALDLALEFSLSPIDRAPNCPSQECFQNDGFSKYLGISNMTMGFVVIVLTILFFVKLRAIQRKPQPVETIESKGNKFKQANLNCIGILLTSLVVTLPSVVIGVSGKTVASAVGPFYFLSLLFAGLLSNIFHVVLNKEMRELGAKCITSKGNCEQKYTFRESDALELLIYNSRESGEQGYVREQFSYPPFISTGL